MNDRALPLPLRRAAALERLRRAKQLMTRAARALIDKHPLAAALGDAALAEHNEARDELAALDAEAAR